ncbi:MAG: c-type cytochrome [Pseudomonadota bacterium]
MSPYPNQRGQLWLACLLSISAVACSALARGDAAGDAAAPIARAATGLPAGQATREQVLRGRQLVISHDCGACHGGNPNPAAKGWLAGQSADEKPTMIGPFAAWPRNLTPDLDTGIGRYSERQLFNALRYGLRPKTTPDITINSMVPGEGNHPATPDYLSPGMPWLYWRFMPDDDLWAIAAYLKHGLRPVSHRVADSGAPPDLWASEYTVAKVGTHVFPTFPTQHERLEDPARREQVLRGRALVAQTACAACHGGAVNPGQDGWLDGVRPERRPELVFQVGPFKTYPRNLTPDNTTGLGRFSERQIFNSLRYGLRPGDTADIEITSTVPAQGNHPAHPKYLAPPMPWPAWRHLDDEALWAIAAYLKHGVKPVRNRVIDSEGPPDFWASEYTETKMGSLPAAPFPTANETEMR